jgi:hypothetical protein
MEHFKTSHVWSQNMCYFIRPLQPCPKYVTSHLTRMFNILTKGVHFLAFLIECQV